MKLHKLPFLFLFLCSQASAAQTYTIEIVDVVQPNTLQIMDSAKRVMQVRLAALDFPPASRQLNKNAIKRLKTLTMGKQAQLQLTPRKTALVSVSGLQLNARLLAEGLAVINTVAIRELPKTLQKTMFQSQQQARQNKLGFWSGQSVAEVQKYYAPYWAEQKIPAPLTRAPVYHPQ